MHSEYKSLFLAAREVLPGFTEIEETKKYRITTYGIAEGGICHMRTMPNGVDVGLLKGSLLEDKYELLETRGSSRRIRVYNFNNLDIEKLKYYLTQSIALVKAYSPLKYVAHGPPMIIATPTSPPPLDPEHYR